MLLLYAIARTPFPSPTMLGVSGGGLTTVSTPMLTAVVERVERAPTWDRPTALAFGQVLARLARSTDLLPTRLGTTVPDLVAALELLSREERAWSDRLDALHGAAELAVRLRSLVDEPAAASSGRQYLRRKMAQSHRDDARVATVTGAVASACREVRRLAGPGDVRLGLLVDRSDCVRVQERLLDLATRDPGLGLTCTGPWPPFSFTEEATA